MLESSLRIGTVAGIRIGVHYTWFIIFFLLVYTLYVLFQHSHPDWGSLNAFITAVITSLLFFASIIFHELGHSIVAIHRGIQVRSITLFIFGGVAQTERDADSAKTEFWVAIAGPLVSILLAGLFFLLSQILGDVSEQLAEALSWLATINFLIAIFNLIPGFPLDGGRVFRALIWGLTGDAAKGMRWAVFGGKAFAYGLMGLGLVMMLRGSYIINGLWMIGIGWFLLIAAEASSKAFMFKNVFARIRVREVMDTDVPIVEPQVSLADWVDQYVLLSAKRAYLVKEAGNVIGLVTLSDTAKLPRADWSTHSVREVMTAITNLHAVDAESDAAKVLQVMGSYSINQVPVMQDNVVIGWIDRDRLVKILQLHTETGR